MANKSLGAAKAAKNDEFYTRFDDAQKELNHYIDQFRGKVVYCNCDDPAESAFSDFFKLNFNHFGLKKLICTRYAESTLFDQFDFDRVRMRGYKLEITSPNDCRKTPLNKKFLAIGSINAITYKEIFPLIKDNELWGGYTNPKEFRRPDESIEKLGNCQWWTNLDVKKRHEFLPLYEKYDPTKYPRYDNYDAINVDKTNEIPLDYDGVMGVPISFLDKYNPEQFEILGMTTGRDECCSV